MGAWDARHRRVRAGLALTARVTANECGQRVSFNSEAENAELAYAEASAWQAPGSASIPRILTHRYTQTIMQAR